MIEFATQHSGDPDPIPTWINPSHRIPPEWSGQNDPARMDDAGGIPPITEWFVP